MANVAKAKYADFGQRLEHACESNPAVPPPNYGRLGWIADQLKARFGTEVTVETVRKWLAGETRPRHEKLMQLATILEVDPEYLLLGRSSGIPEKDRRLQSAEATGYVNILAGYVSVDGGRPAFPQEDDRRAQKAKIDLYAVIKGRHYAFAVAVGKRNAEGCEFSVPVDALDDAVVIGAVRDGFCCEFLELDPDAVRSQGTRSGEVYRVKVPMNVDGTPWRKIQSFADRI